VKPHPVRRVRWRDALRRTVRDVGLLVPVAVAYWAITGATTHSAMWAALWLALITAGHLGINYHYVHRRTKQSQMVRRRQPRPYVKKVAGTTRRAAARSNDV
jgi:hypothetical protein